MDESLSKTISQYVHFAPENLAQKNFYQVLYKTISKLNFFFDDVAKRMPAFVTS